MSDEELIARWDDYVESMGSVMGEVEHMAQQMRDRIEALVRERDKAALWATEQHACADNYALRLGQEKARAEQLEAALSWYSDDPSSQGDVARAALKGDKT